MEDKSIYDLWAMLICRKSAGTARSYQDALTRFTKDYGKSVEWEHITPEFVDAWRKKMLSEVSRTTTNIYLRAFSAVLNTAFEAHLIHVQPKFLFRGLGIFSPHASNSRRFCYLPASKWRKLWDFYRTKGKGYPEVKKWRSDYKRKYFEAVGLMLLMYLGNGMNLRDLCMLRYNRFYFQTGRQQLQFCRHKTAERTNATVELPILPEMRIILQDLANPPKEGELMFNYLADVIGDEALEYEQTSLLGSVIRKRMKSVCKVLGWDAVPTPTWARHSFATNLIQAGVPKDYVSWAMAHSSNDVTSRYIASYGYEQMVEFNSLLLCPKQTSKHILSQVATLPTEEKEKLISELLKDMVICG